MKRTLRAQVARLAGSALDSAIVESACLERGMDTFRLSSIVVLASYAGGSRRAAFRGSASMQTSQFAHRITANRELRHVTLREAGIPVPAAEFIKVKDSKQIAVAVRALRYPVLAKPLAKRGTREWNDPALDDKGLSAALAGLSGDKITAGGAGRVVLEQFVPGTKTSLIVVDGGIAGWLRKSGGASAPTAGFSREAIHPDFVELAVRTLNAVPGAGHGEVVIACDDLGRSASKQKHSIVSLNAIPRIAGGAVPADWSRHIAHAIVTGAGDGPVPVRSDVRVTMRAMGVTEPSRFAEALLRGAEGSDVEGRVETASADSLTLSLAGSAWVIATISVLSLSGAFASQTPEHVEYTQRS